MIIYHQTNVAGFVGAHRWFLSVPTVITQRIAETTAAATVFARPLVNAGLINRGLINAGLID